MTPLNIISARYENPLFSRTGSSTSTGFTRLASDSADQYGPVFSGTSLSGLYTNTGALASGTIISPIPSQRSTLSSGFQRQSALTAYGKSNRNTASTTPSPTSLATSVRQSALRAPLTLYGSEQPSLAQSLDLFA